MLVKIALFLLDFLRSRLDPERQKEIDEWQAGCDAQDARIAQLKQANAAKDEEIRLLESKNTLLAGRQAALERRNVQLRDALAELESRPLPPPRSADDLLGGDLFGAGGAGPATDSPVSHR